MKKPLLTSVAALLLATGAAHASPRLLDLQPAGYVCEGMFGHATVFFDTNEGVAYFQINRGKTLKERIETYWYQNKFGHVEGDPPFYLTRVWWGSRQHAINTHQPSEFHGATYRTFTWEHGYWAFQSAYLGFQKNGNQLMPLVEFIGNCIGDFEAGKKLKENEL